MFCCLLAALEALEHLPAASQTIPELPLPPELVLHLSLQAPVKHQALVSTFRKKSIKSAGIMCIAVDGSKQSAQPGSCLWHVLLDLGR